MSEESESALNGIESALIDIAKRTPTLRDQFAMAALQGIIANSFNDGRNRPLSDGSISDHVDMAYDYADAMLKERAS